MQPTTETRREQPATFTPPQPPSLLVQALACTISGQPLPAAVQGTAAHRATPASARDGIARILAGPPG